LLPAGKIDTNATRGEGRDGLTRVCLNLVWRAPRRVGEPNRRGHGDEWLRATYNVSRWLSRWAVFVGKDQDR
jgi:hypothetical protein